MTTLTSTLQALPNHLANCGTLAHDAVVNAVAEPAPRIATNRVDAFRNSVVDSTLSGARIGIGALQALDRPVGALRSTPNCPPVIHQLRNCVFQGVTLGLAGAKAFTGAIGALLGAVYGAAQGASNYQGFQAPAVAKSDTPFQTAVQDAEPLEAAKVATVDVKNAVVDYAT